MSDRGNAVLTKRWTKLRNHQVQQAFWASRYRFNVVPAARRSGKTELAKRRWVRRALDPNWSRFDDPRYFFGAPTRDQAKRIYWEDLKKMVPKALIIDISESELTITTALNSQLVVVGLDKPERIEGSPWDGGVLDEYGNMKAKTWKENVRPALSDRQGGCDLIGVPEGRNHYWETAEDAKAFMLDGSSEWGYFHWISADILPASEIEAAKRDLDPLTYQQEYEGSFINFKGRAYYNYGDHNTHALRYDPRRKLYLGFDFNVDPGVCVICQPAPVNNRPGLHVIGEVYIPVNSNTEAVCRKVIQDWGHHEGTVYLFGDATGGARKTSSTYGSDWDIIHMMLRPVFGERMMSRVPSSNPSERARVNAVNSLCRSASGEVRLWLDPRLAPNTHRDLEGTRLLEGGSGEIDKKHDEKLTHLSDAIGYIIEREFPTTQRTISTIQVVGV